MRNKWNIISVGKRKKKCSTFSLVMLILRLDVWALGIFPSFFILRVFLRFWSIGALGSLGHLATSDSPLVICFSTLSPNVLFRFFYIQIWCTKCSFQVSRNFFAENEMSQFKLHFGMKYGSW